MAIASRIFSSTCCRKGAATRTIRIDDVFIGQVSCVGVSTWRPSVHLPKPGDHHAGIHREDNPSDGTS